MKKKTYTIKYFNPNSGLTYTMARDFKFYLATAVPLEHFDYNTARTLAYTNIPLEHHDRVMVKGPRGGSYPLTNIKGGF